MKLATLLVSASLFAAPTFAQQCASKSTVQATHVSHNAMIAGETHKAEKSDIVETAAAAGSFSTLLAAAEAAGLVDALKSEGPLTVFAPTDEAFAALPAGTVETLLQPENKEALAGVLKLHVIAGSKVKSKDLAGQQITASTLNGDLSVDGTDGVVLTAPGSSATVIAADVGASNGVIHVIDTVLLPAG
nr:fasciclin domain-containing protein [Hyphomonas sp. Mor2]